MDQLFSDLQELEKITARRNTALTIFEPSDLSKILKNIKKAVSCIKHDNKRNQLSWLVRNLEERVVTNNIKSGIICIAIKTDGNIYFKHIAVDVTTSEYYYDDCFHLLRIQEVIYSLKSLTQKEIAELEQQLSCNIVNYELDINNISADASRKIYVIIQDNTPIPLRLLIGADVSKINLIKDTSGTLILKSCKIIALKQNHIYMKK